jgi:putative flippase GtrA
VPQTSDPDRGAPVAVSDARPHDENLPPGVAGEDGLLFRIIKDRRVAFLFVGGLNTAIGTMWFALFDFWLGTKWNGYGHYPALILTYIVSILCAFVLYRRIVFKVHGNVLRDLARFSTVYISAFAINLVLLWVMVHVFHWHPFLSQCLITFVTTVLSWVGHNRYSFRRPAVEDEATGSPTLVAGQDGPTAPTAPTRPTADAAPSTSAPQAPGSPEPASRLRHSSAPAEATTRPQEN